MGWIGACEGAERLLETDGATMNAELAPVEHFDDDEVACMEPGLFEGRDRNRDLVLAEIRAISFTILVKAWPSW